MVSLVVKNDLRDWEAGREDKVVSGQDVLSGRPTILRAFARDGGRAEIRRVLEEKELSPRERVARLRDIYDEHGAFRKAERLLERYRRAAKEEAENVGSEQLTELMRFIVEIVL